MKKDEQPRETVIGEPGRAPLSVPPPQRLPWLDVFIGGEAYSRELPDPCLFGRDPEATVSLPDQGVSRRHARIVREGDLYLIEDLGSRNGTLVNGERVDRKALKSGDRIQLGGQVMLLFRLRDPLEERVLETYAMEAIGRLSAGVNHEFNNMLSIVLGSSGFLEELPPETTLGSQEVQECLADIREACAWGAELTARLALLTQSGGHEQEIIDLTKLSEEVLDLVRRTFPRSIEVRGQIDRGLFVRGARNALHTLLVNPCLNARDAMPEGGTLQVDVHFRRGMRGAASVIVIEISDSGRGMDAEVLRRAGEPFFSTKRRGIGAGLGLATVRKVARELAGRVEIASQIGLGTRVVIELPALARDQKREKESEPPAHAAPERGAGPCHVLVVDDAEPVARAVGRALTRAGHRTSYARDGIEALELFRAERGGIDLVLLDLDMPRMGGRACFRELRAIDPEVPVVFMSGLAIEARTDEEASVPFVAKPVDPAKLLPLISRLARPRK